jgi:hypothetical protein
MTVKLLGPWGPQPAGTLYTTDATTEAAMVAAKVATADLTGGVVYVPPGGATAAAGSSSGGGGFGGGGGSDQTAATLDAYGIATYTAGAQWVITRDGSGVPLYEALKDDPGSTLRSILTDVGGGIYVVSSGLKHVSGALCMTLAQRNTWTAIAGVTIDLGFKIFVTDVGLIRSTAGVDYVPGAEQVWAGSTVQWLWTSPVVYKHCQDGTVIPPSTASTSSKSMTIPAGVAGPYSNVLWQGELNNTAAVACTALLDLNGTTLFSVSSGNFYHKMYKTVHGRGPSLQRATRSAYAYDVQGADAAPIALTINMATTALVFDLRIATGAAVSSNVQVTSVTISDKQGAWQ